MFEIFRKKLYKLLRKFLEKTNEGLEKNME